eukprot:g6674.t1
MVEHYAEAVAELALQNKWILVELDMAQDFYYYGPSSQDRQPASTSEAVDLMEGEAAHFLGRELWEELNRGSTTTSTGSSSSSSTERLIALRRLLRTLRDRLQQGAFRGGFNNVELEPWLLDDQRMMEVLFQHGGALVEARARQLAHEVVDGERTTDSRAVSVQVDRTCVFAAALWKKREEARRRSSASALRSSDFVRDDVDQVRQDGNFRGPLRRRDTLLDLLMGSSIPATQPDPVRVDSFPATQPDHQVDSFPATQPDQVDSFIPATQPDHQGGRQHGGERHDDEAPNVRAAGMINSRGPCHRLRRLGASEHLGEVAAVDRHVRSNTSPRRGKRPLVGKDKRKYQLPIGLTATGSGHTQILVTVQKQTKKRSSSSSAAATTGGGGSRAERIKIDPAQYPSVEVAIAEAVKVLNEKLLTKKN